MEVRETPDDVGSDPLLKGIHKGETAAIALAAALPADLVLMDDRKGVKAARAKGLRVTGTLGILELAARDGLLDFGQPTTAMDCRSPRLHDVFLSRLIHFG